MLRLLRTSSVISGPLTPETERRLDHTVGQVAEALDKHPVDAMLDIAVADGLKTDFFAAPPNVSLDHLKEIVSDPYILLGVSDGGVHTKFLTAGRFPTEALIKIVREHDMLSLEEAHWRLAALPAMLPREVVHDLPGGESRWIQRTRGYRYVLVNGAVTIEDDRETNTFSGRPLRSGGGAPAPKVMAV
jgi:N-acyl-D-amino-acid deacylase